MNRKNFLATLIIAPIAALFAKKAEAVPQQPAIPADPFEPPPNWGKIEGAIIGVDWAEGKDSTVYTPNYWLDTPIEDRWQPGQMGCCMNRGPSACDLCRRPGANPEKDKAMYRRRVAEAKTDAGREVAQAMLDAFDAREPAG